jgi:hypothetical protein
MDYFNEARTHLSLNKDAPISRAVERAGTFFAGRSWADYIIGMSGFDLRQAQVCLHWDENPRTSAVRDHARNIAEWTATLTRRNKPWISPLVLA